MILEAPVYDVARETPLEHSTGLSARLENNIWYKREDLQPVFSFKLRGAYNKISRLSEEVARKGIIAASAGNHAQGVALAAKRCGVKAVIVMPKTTPEIKVNAVRSLGARTVLYGDAYDDAYDHAMELVRAKNMTFIHPYDDRHVIAGQGTIGVEILKQHTGDLHAIFVPVGGGGLIAGIAVYVKQMRPDIKIIGVEPHDAPSMHHALQRNRRVTLKQVGIFVDGVAVRQVGKETFKIARQYVDEVILVDTDEVCAAIKDIFDDNRSIVEPAGALAVAGLKTYVQRTGIRQTDLVAINSGANMNFDRLRHVAERAELGEQREALFAVTVRERPGSFRHFCQVLGHRGITEFNYRFGDSDEAHVFAGIQLRGGDEERHALVTRLREKDFPVTDLTDDEMAKLHVRYMVGGHAPGLQNEILYRFEFPERPGALLGFLTCIGDRWNISLFHYRNHGAAYGRVLVGVQVPAKDRPRFRKFLDQLGYSYWEETGNPAHALFLS